MTTLNNDLVSIITPAFRAESVIGETIKSVIAQTYSNWEMLIAEDCSPDSTRDVICQWAQNCYFAGADPDKIVRALRSGFLETDDAETATEDKSETEIVSMRIEKR